MKFSPEFQSEERHELISKAHKKAEEVITRDRIDSANFTDLYGKEIVAEDLRYVSTREAEFASAGASTEEADRLKLATIFEAILHEHGEQSNWFGDNATTVKTSRFDDIANGVDEVVEFLESESSVSFLALAIDATTSHHLEAKFRDIEAGIKSGKLARVKYFAAENVDIRGELSGIPRVLVGADRKTIATLSELWLAGKNQDLARHPIQFQILEQVEMQCHAFARFANQEGRAEVAVKYEAMAVKIADIISEKKKTLVDSGERDSVFGTIRDLVA